MTLKNVRISAKIKRLSDTARLIKCTLDCYLCIRTYISGTEGCGKKKKKHIKECFTCITKEVKELQQEVRVDEKKKINSSKIIDCMNAWEKSLRVSNPFRKNSQTLKTVLHSGEYFFSFVLLRPPVIYMYSGDGLTTTAAGIAFITKILVLHDAKYL